MVLTVWQEEVCAFGQSLYKQLSEVTRTTPILQERTPRPGEVLQLLRATRGGVEEAGSESHRPALEAMFPDPPPAQRKRS